MASLFRALRSADEERSDLPLPFQDWVGMMYNGLQYQFPSGSGGSLSQDRENIASSFQGYVDGAYKSNGVVFACMAARMFLFSEARFQFQRIVKGRPGKLWGDQTLKLLETPWKGGTTGDLLTRMIQHADLAGNAYVLRQNGALRLLRPDWVTIILGSRTGSEVDNELIGYSYKPGGHASDEDPIGLLPEQVAHFAPNPDPGARFRGMSWLTPVINEILADGAATRHKLSYFQNGATPNRVVTLDAAITAEKFNAWIETFENSFKGAVDAYKTLYLGGGADVTVVGNDMKQIDFRVTQGHGETRIAAAAGSPPIYVGLSEGLEAATYSNYGQAVRRFADGTMRPLWRNAAGSLARIITVPSDSRLWYDDRDIPALQEDSKDEAAIQKTNAETIHTLVIAGFDPDTAVNAVLSDDFNLLLHSGMYSVQLMPPGVVGEGKGALVSGQVAPSGDAKSPTPSGAAPNPKKTP